MPLEQDVLDIGKQLEKIVADGNSVRFLCLFVFCLFFFASTKNINPLRPNPGRREKTNLNFYFHSSLWYLKRFYEGL